MQRDDAGCPQSVVFPISIKPRFFPHTRLDIAENRYYTFHEPHEEQQGTIAKFRIFEASHFEQFEDSVTAGSVDRFAARILRQPWPLRCLSPVSEQLIWYLPRLCEWS